MDFITPLSKTQNGITGIFVVVDRLSKLIRSLRLRYLSMPRIQPAYYTKTFTETTDSPQKSFQIVTQSS
jgi:hypothetical protein